MSRCIHFFIRGFFMRLPAPYHRDYRCWSAGQDTSFVLMLFCVIGGWAMLSWLIGNAILNR